MDEKGLREALDIFFEATNTANAEMFAKVFHDDAHRYQVGDDGVLSIWDKPTFLNVIRSITESWTAYNELLSIDFTSENTAAVRLKVRVKNLIYTDILSFIRVDGKWMIISKLTCGVPA